MIGMAPDRTGMAGDPIGSSGRAIRRFSMWGIEEGPDEETLETYLGALLDRVAPVRESVRALSSDPRVHSVSLWVWWAGEDFALDIPRLPNRRDSGLGCVPSH